MATGSRRRIVLGLRVEMPAGAAARRAQELARALDAELVVVSVAPPDHQGAVLSPSLYGLRPTPELQAWRGELASSVARVAREVAADLVMVPAADPQAAAVAPRMARLARAPVLVADPAANAEAVAASARRAGAGAIGLARARRPWWRLLRRSTARLVLERAGRSVLVVPLARAAK